MVRKGGFEPPRLSAPPPQDGVSASSTTSALCELHVFNSSKTSSCEGIYNCTGFTPTCRTRRAPSGCCKSANHTNNLRTATSRGSIAHGRLNVIVSGDILQRKGIVGSYTLRPRSEKYDAERAGRHRHEAFGGVLLGPP